MIFENKKSEGIFCGISEATRGAIPKAIPEENKPLTTFLRI